MTIHIVVVDDHQIVRQGVISLLKVLRPSWVVTEAEDSVQAVQLIRKESPNLVIMDITMPGSSGLEAVSALRNSGFTRPILMFTMHKGPQLGNETRRAGAQGYVLKSQAADDLVRAIDTLLAGGTFFGAPPAPEGTQDKPNPSLMFYIGFAQAFA